MKPPSAEDLARTLATSPHERHQRLAVDVLRVSGYTKRAAKREVSSYLGDTT